MRDHYEQVYYQTPTSYQAPEQHLVKKSSGNVLGRFLKLGKSKSDAHGYGPKNRATSYHDDLEEDFRLTPSIKGPVEKMVHKANSRKDVSRSHSWIYGSVKLPSDLPFGYGYHNGFGSNGHSPNSGGGSSGSNSSPSHGPTSMQIPRCQMVDYCCSCDCSGDFDFLSPGPGSSQSNSPCQACVLEAGKYGGKNRKHQSQQESSKNFVSSVRKLTWKSLKQAVKKRPSLDSIKKSNGITPAASIPALPSSIEIMPSPNGPHIPSHPNDDRQPSYFFPEKKNFYASCNDLYGEPGPHVTASVRVRPKRSRQPWPFSNEFGPVPNYQEEDLYHSEWDLRQYMPYDMWLTATNNVKPRVNIKATSPTPESSSHANNSIYSAKVPAKTSSGAPNGKSSTRVPPPSSSSSSNDTIVINHSNNTGSSNINSNPNTSSSTNNNNKGSVKANTGIVKRSSILHADVTAYQLLKAQTKKKSTSSEGAPRLEDELSESSDDLSDNVLTDDPVRIGGQGIYMVSSVIVGNGSSVNNGANRGFAHQILSKSANLKSAKQLSSLSSEGVWLDHQISSKGSQSKHASSNRDRDQQSPEKVNNRLIDLHDRDMTMNHTSNSFTPQTQSVAMPKPPPLPSYGTENGISNLHNSNSQSTVVTHVNSGLGNSVRSAGGSNDLVNSLVLSNSNHSSTSTTSYSNDSNNNLSNDHNSISVVSKSSYNSNEIRSTPHGYDSDKESSGNRHMRDADESNDGFEAFVYDENATSCNETNVSDNSQPTTISSFNNMISASENRNRPVNRNPLAQSSMRDNPFDSNNHRNNHNSSSANAPPKLSTPVNNNSNGNSSQQTHSHSNSVSFADNSFNSSNNNGRQYQSNSNGSSSNSSGKYGALRRRKGRNGPGGKNLLRETIYEEDYDDHTEDRDENNEKSQSHSQIHANRQLGYGKEYHSVKIVVSQQNGSSNGNSNNSNPSSEYVKPILKNRDRVYETPNNNINKAFGNGQNSNQSGFSNSNEIYFDSSVSTASKKKVQFDSSKVIVCGGDSGSDYYDDDDSNEESSANEFKSSDEQPVDEDDTDDADTLCDEDIHNDSPVEKTNRVITNTSHNNDSRNGSSDNLNGNGSTSCKPPRKENSSPRSSESLSGEQKMPARGKSSFEEEVARKAAAIAAALAKKKLAEEEQEELYDEVNNLQPQQQQNLSAGKTFSAPSNICNSSNNDNGNGSKLSKQRSDTNHLDDSIKNKNLKSNLTQSTSSALRSTPSAPPKRDHQVANAPRSHKVDTNTNPLSKNEKTEIQTKNSNKTPHGPPLKAERIANASEKGCGPQKIINPNSLLFNDTTRIRLNQSRPSLNETFKLGLSQNGLGEYGTVLSNGGSRLANKLNRVKQSNSFRASTTGPLRPREPPPPPPIVRSISEEGKSSAKSSSPRNPKVEQIYQKSHYGPGGNKLPTKSQISLPFGFTTTSSQNSSPSSPSKSQKNGEQKTQLAPRSSVPISNSSGKNIRVGQNRSKSLTDRCEALEKVLSQRNQNSNVNKSASNGLQFENAERNGVSSQNNSHVSPQHMKGKAPQNPNDKNPYAPPIRNEYDSSRHSINNKIPDNSFPQQPTHNLEESQNIEIVTKENSVSEIRIYSGPTNLSTNSGNCNKVIVYDSTTMLANPGKNSHVNSNNTQEIHYAATDLFPHPSSTNNNMPHGNSSSNTNAYTATTNNHINNVNSQHSRQSSTPSLTSTRPHSTSVVLIIDTGAESPDSITATSKNSATNPIPPSPLTYSQPVDLLPPAPQLPLPPPPPVPPHSALSLRSKTNRIGSGAPLVSNEDKTRMAVEENESDSEEPLYDDVINHTMAPSPLQKFPSPVSTYNNNNKSNQNQIVPPSTDKMKIVGDIGVKKSSYGPSNVKPGRPTMSILNGKGNQSPLNLPPPPPLPPNLPPPPPPPTNPPSKPHTHSGNVLSSTLPCLACPPTLPPPNLPAKNLSEFQHRPLVINHEEDEDDEVDDLYNHISDENSTVKANCFSKGPGSSSSSSSLSTLKNYEYDRRSGFSGPRSICSSRHEGLSDENEENIIYDDTLSIISNNCDESKNNKMTSSSPSSKFSSKSLINHMKGGSPHKKAQAPQAPNKTLNSLSSSGNTILHMNNSNSKKNSSNNSLAVCREEIEKNSDIEEPLYDDVLNLTENNDDENKRKSIAESCGGDSGADCDAEDAPPPLPAQGPPLHLLPKISTDLPLLTFPLLASKITDTPKYSSSIISPVSLHSSTNGGNNNVRKCGPDSVGKDVDGENDSHEDKKKLNKGNTQDLQLSRCKFKAGDNSNSCDAINQGRTEEGQLNHPYRSNSASILSSRHQHPNKHNANNNNHVSKPSPHNLPVFEEETEIELGKEPHSSIQQQSPNKFLALDTQNANGSNTSGNNNIINSTNSNEDDVLDRTRTLLNELNEKLSKLNFVAPDYSTYISKVVISSSSESSGVEEDYNSEKNYSLSNGSDVASSSDENYKLSAVSKLVSETISMARGKFLDSMKLSMLSGGSGGSMLNLNPPAAGSNPNSVNSVSPVSNGGSRSPETEEPIYEEIGDMNRSTSPIYADAFDAKSIFDGASRNEILSFLESIRDRLTATESNSSDSQSSSLSSKKGRNFIEIERNDSGIGSESGSLVAVTNNGSGSNHSILINSGNVKSVHRLCPDCNDAHVDSATLTAASSEEEIDENGVRSSAQNLCPSCNRKRNERREIIMEIYETELKYGRDLKIIAEEFYNPIQIAGLLTKEQLDQIFLNVDELIQINLQLTSMMKAAIESVSGELHNENLTAVNVGKIFVDFGESMMCAFENYCTRQANAGALLTQLEKEKELLRIFLRVSQMENTVLRRMNLPAFLMVPVQRVTRYPLLLSRLLKVTPVDHFSRDELQSAQEKIEQHLEHMNKTTREVASVKLWRRISIINSNNSPIHRRSGSDLDGANVRIRKMALDVLDWANFSDVTCVIENQLNAVHFNGKILRNIYGCLLARGKDLESLALKMDQDVFFPPAEDVVKDVKLVLVRAKNTRFCLLREPLCLSKCVISQGENEFLDFIEINEITTKNTYYIQGMDKHGTSMWLKLLQCHAVCVGQWRRRRGALANIMMNGMIRHL